jgi:parallel beta-helix repeat protein
MKKTIFQNITLVLLIAVLSSGIISLGSEGIPPIADAGLPRYAAQDPVVLDGTGSYESTNSSTLSYTWQQISGPTVVISDADTATPTITGFVQTDENQECEFELIVSNGQYDSLPDTVRVVVVPDFGQSNLKLQNDSFDTNKPTFIYFGGGNCVTGSGSWYASAWLKKANIISIPNYGPDSGGDDRTYYKYGDMIIVYLSSVAPDYKQPIQTSGYSTGGQPAIDVGIRLNLTYADVRYAVNRVTFLEATRYCRDSYSESITTFLGSSVDGEQCWIDAYVSTLSGGHTTNDKPYHENVLNVWFPTATGGWLLRHFLAQSWYKTSLTKSDMNDFNHGVVAGTYCSVIGPGKNLQLASTPGAQTYKFQWFGPASSGYMDFYDESNHPGRLPEPITLVGPENESFVDADGAVFSCEESENAVGYQLLFGSDPYRVMDFYIITDTLNPPSEVITASPFEQTWWTVRAYDQYGSTIYADPIRVNFENPATHMIENITIGKRYDSFRHAIDDARNGHEIVVSPGVYQGNINFRGKNLTVRSTNPDDPAVVAATILSGNGNGNLITFSNNEDASCVLSGFTMTNANNGIYCFGSSPTITNCSIVGNVSNGIKLYMGSNPIISNCIIAENGDVGIAMLKFTAGREEYFNSPTIINCTIVNNSRRVQVFEYVLITKRPSSRWNKKVYKQKLFH